MIKFTVAIALGLLGAVAPVLPAACAQTAPAGTKVLLDTTARNQERLAPTSPQVTVTRGTDAAASGLLVAIQPGKEDYPGVAVKPEATSWDLAQYGHVEARIVNTGAKPLTLALRVDNAGDWHDNPWNTESVTLEPGAVGTVRVIFGYAYGQKPNYPLKPNAIVNLLFFAAKSDAPQSFRIESIIAGGPAGEKPPVAPDDVREKPKNGVLGSKDGKPRPIRVVLPPSAAEDVLAINPEVGRWDLRDYVGVQVRVRNPGKNPVTPRVQVNSNGGSSEWVSLPLKPGASGTITVPFAVGTDLGKPGSGSKVTSDAIIGVKVMAEQADVERILAVDAILAYLPPAPKLPAWLGKQPPVAGEWVQTFEDEFNGAALDTNVWDPVGENYYDKATHWSKKNVLLGDGFARLRYEKKTGYQNDDPKRNQTNYAAGYLNSYTKWAQRYGYFEARMKLPTAPGLWPAFWLMPDRGPSVGPEQWKRQDTKDGGMEFDIMEHLTRWGPYRYNIAMHYDGYEKEHKSLGTDKVYVQPDKDGFVTCGLLWTPGLAVYYCNGQQVLRWENPRISNVTSCIMFTLPSGGWDNNAVEDARLPADFVIDYVRVWQRKDLASDADSKPYGIRKAK